DPGKSFIRLSEAARLLKYESSYELYIWKLRENRIVLLFKIIVYHQQPSHYLLCFMLPVLSCCLGTTSGASSRPGYIYQVTNGPTYWPMLLSALAGAAPRRTTLASLTRDVAAVSRGPGWPSHGWPGGSRFVRHREPSGRAAAASLP